VIIGQLGRTASAREGPRGQVLAMLASGCMRWSSSSTRSGGSACWAPPLTERRMGHPGNQISAIGMESSPASWTRSSPTPASGCHANHRPEHTPTRPARRHPPRVFICRLTCTDENLGRRRPASSTSRRDPEHDPYQGRRQLSVIPRTVTLVAEGVLHRSLAIDRPSRSPRLDGPANNTRDWNGPSSRPSCRGQCTARRVGEFHSSELPPSQLMKAMLSQLHAMTCPKTVIVEFLGPGVSGARRCTLRDG
jgi:hypothetical protein